VTVGRALGRWLVAALVVAQTVLGARVGLRLARTARGKRIPRVQTGQAQGAAPTTTARAEGATVAVIVPVLNEWDRLGPCLEGLAAQGREVVDVLVVDGGSDDGTVEAVRAVAAREARIRLIEAGEAPAGWNGKVHNLAAGLAQASSAAGWILTVDADVRPEPELVASLLAFARREGVTALSVATRQRLSGAAEAVLHPALLATLVYRFGIPGSATDRVADVQANGQCFLVRRDALTAVGGFAPLRDSLCEDVTLARRLAAAGERVGFYETEGLVAVEMYRGWRDAWRNWTRSLPMRDRYSGVAGWVGLAEVALVQAAPAVALAAGLAARRGRGPRRGRLANRPDRAGSVASAVVRVNTVLLAMRLGVLVGTRRAYERPPWTSWLSPVCDGPAAVGVWLSAVRRRHEWRGRPIVRGGTR